MTVMQAISHDLTHHEHSQALTGVAGRRCNRTCHPARCFLHQKGELPTQVLFHRCSHSSDRHTNKRNWSGSSSPLPPRAFIFIQKEEADNMFWMGRATQLCLYLMTQKQTTGYTSSYQGAGWSLLLNPRQYKNAHSREPSPKKLHDCSKPQIKSHF